MAHTRQDPHAERADALFVEHEPRAWEQMVRAVALLIEVRDPYTAGHQRRVAELGGAIARKMKLSETQTQVVRLAAAAHDVGKLYVPVAILNKPTRLTETEFDLIKAHSEAGYEILRALDASWPIARIVRQHHERLDGSGYPLRLAGETIGLEARILAVADVVEAMVSHRPYRAAMGIDRALEEIALGRGVLYDPEVADACLELFTARGFVWKRSSELDTVDF